MAIGSRIKNIWEVHGSKTFAPVQQELRKVPRNLRNFFLNPKTAPSLIAILFTVYLLWQNTFFASDWWLVPIRDIDDYAMQLSAAEMRRLIVHGEWGEVFRFFHYAYGLGWWILAAGLSVPGAILGDPTITVIVGRGASLLAVLLTSVLVARTTTRAVPQARGIEPWVLLLGFLTPVAIINSTKLIVAGWSALLTVLGVYLLMRARDITSRTVVVPSIVTGAAIGFKLVAITALPIFLALVFFSNARARFARSALSSGIIMSSAVLIGAPSLAAGFIDPGHPNRILRTFQTFRDMGSIESISLYSKTFGGLEYFGSSLVLILLFGGIVVVWTSSSVTKKNRALFASASASIAMTWVGLVVLLDKPPIYIAVYSLNVSVFLPMGLAALAHHTKKNQWHTTLAMGVVLTNVLMSTRMQPVLTDQFNFYGMYRSQAIAEKIEAGRAIERFLGEDLDRPRVLQDSSAVFPKSRIDGSADLNMIYGNLRDYLEQMDEYEFLVIMRDTYYQAPNPMEEDLRRELESSGEIGNGHFTVVLDVNNVILFERSGE